VPEACFETGWGVRVLVAGQVAGVMGLVNQAVRDEWRLAEPVGLLELRLDSLLPHLQRPPEAVRPVAPYPGVERHVALVVDEAVSHEAVLDVIWSVAPSELTAARLFDIYRGRELGAGCKSMAYALTYRAADRTLTDEDANALHERIKAALRERLSATLREG